MHVISPYYWMHGEWIVVLEGQQPQYTSVSHGFHSDPSQTLQCCSQASEYIHFVKI